ncbi:MAG TPA: glycosyltransferase family 39 protein [Chryseolinea sp.]|nr:glycosyltransferase family 39 protein [Chryseolinea sp.]
MSTKELLASYLKDIRFWIIFFFILRMYGITNPPLEVGHNWRQTDGLMITRNLYERDASIFYPTVDVAGDLTGIVGSEFPILNYIIYLFSLIVGYEHWLGRLVVLITASIGILYFHKLIKRYFGEPSAFNATILLLVSFWFSYSRKIIPDAFAASLCIISLYYAFMYLDEGKVYRLFLFFILALMGCLSKIMVATILTILVFPLFNSLIPLQRKVLLSIFSLLILVKVCWWYFVWVPYLNATYGYGSHFFMGMSFSQGLDYIFQDFGLVMKRLYNNPFKYTGFAAFLAGVFLIVKNRQWLTLGVFLLPFLAFLVILVKTGASIIGDTYYVITVIPAMAFIAGRGLAYINNKKIVVAILVIVGIESIAAQIYDFRLREPYKSLATLEGIMDTVSERNDLIVINSGEHNPTAMYFSHRRGWTVASPIMQDSLYMNDLKNKGCKYAVLATKLFEDLELKYPMVHKSEYFKVYKLE